MTTPDMSQMAELPQYGIAVSPDYQIWLTINYGTAAMSFYLCGPDNYEEVARKIHKNIMDAGREARRARSGLVVAKGNHDATLRQAEGREQRGQSRPRP